MAGHDKIRKNRDISTKIKSRLLVLTVATYECESWTTRTNESEKINAF